MAVLVVYSILLISLATVLIELWRGQILTGYRGLSACTIAFWVWPQCHQLMLAEEFPPHILLSLAMLIVICFTAILAGSHSFWIVRSEETACRPPQAYSSELLTIMVVAMGCVGVWAFYKMSGLILSASEDNGGQWSGPITIYFFFSKFSFYAGCLSMAYFVMTGSRYFLALSLIFLTQHLYRFLAYGKREAALSLLIIAALTIRFRYERRIPAGIAVLCIALGLVFSSSVVAYRNHMWTDGVGYLLSVPKIPDLITSGEMTYDFHRSSTQDLELRNTAILITLVQEGHGYDFGQSLRGKLVDSLIPVQIFGSTFTSALKGPQGVSLENSGYQTKTGLTVTGFSTAYMSFSYLGGLLFFAISAFFTSITHAAQQGNFKAIVTTMILLPESVLAITHSVGGFIVAGICAYIFVILPLKYIELKLVGEYAPVMNGGRF